MFLICPSGSISDEEDGQDAEEEDEDGEPLLAVEKRARILDKKRYYLKSGFVLT